MSNTWAIYPSEGDNLPKGGLIPRTTAVSHGAAVKGGVFRDLPPEEEPAAYQLVGEVAAHQGYDG